MQRISALWSSRERTKSLTGAHVGGNAGTINTLPHRQRPEDYWPSNLDRESEKAARILQAFCSTSLCPFNALQGPDALSHQLT